MWGSLIDPLLSKYHWSFDYLLWDVSLVNITMLQLDEYLIFEENSNTENSNSSYSKPTSAGSSVKKGLSYGELVSLLMNSQNG